MKTQIWFLVGLFVGFVLGLRITSFERITGRTLNDILAFINVNSPELSILFMIVVVTIVIIWANKT